MKKSFLQRTCALFLCLVIIIGVNMTALATDTSINYDVTAGGSASAESEIFSFSDVKDLLSDPSEKTIGNAPFTLTFTENQFAQIRPESLPGTKLTAYEFGSSDNNVPMEIKRDARWYLNRTGINTPVEVTLISPINLEADLMIRTPNNGTNDVKPSTLTLNQPITVKDKATLLLDSVDNVGVSVVNPTIFVNNVPDNGAAIVLEKGGTLRLGAVTMKDAENSSHSAFVQSNGGTIVIHEITTSFVNDPNVQALPPMDECISPGGNNQTCASLTVENSPLVKAAGNTTVDIRGGKITVTGNSPIISFENGCTGTVIVSGGEISSNVGSALTIPAGVTLDIPADSTAKVTTTASDEVKAIDLVDGAILKKGETTITVGTDESDDETADNYVDNYGNIILAKGATKDTNEMNAAVILSDGTIIEGSKTESPTLIVDETTGKATISVPKDGKVTKSDGTNVDMSYGGSVSEGTGENDTNTIKPNPKPSPGGSVIVPSYSITTPSVQNGTVTVSPSSASKGSTVTITATPDKGYKLDTLTVTDANGNKLTLTDAGNGKYTFVMPSSKVTINATFAKEAHVCLAEKFTDVDVTAWYHDSVCYCLSNGLMVGQGNNTFGPNATLTRAQLAQILYNKAGKPTVSKPSTFTDVPATQWYANAIAWAQQNNVVNGIGGGKFAPDQKVTREQFTAMLYRNENSPAVTGTLNFKDAAKVSNWAQDAMLWATQSKVINGAQQSDGTLLLNATLGATRAEAATMLMNFCENVEK